MHSFNRRDELQSCIESRRFLKQRNTVTVKQVTSLLFLHNPFSVFIWPRSAPRGDVMCELHVKREDFCRQGSWESEGTSHDAWEYKSGSALRQMCSALVPSYCGWLFHGLGSQGSPGRRNEGQRSRSRDTQSELHQPDVLITETTTTELEAFLVELSNMCKKKHYLT